MGRELFRFADRLYLWVLPVGLVNILERFCRVLFPRVLFVQTGHLME